MAESLYILINNLRWLQEELEGAAEDLHRVIKGLVWEEEHNFATELDQIDDLDLLARSRETFHQISELAREHHVEFKVLAKEFKRQCGRAIRETQS